jgi:Acetyltransferase (isoleucine patch superfamily)
MLTNQGLNIGYNTFIGNNVTIDSVFPWMISIGSGCFLTNGVVILAHDSSLENFLSYGKVGRVSIGKNTFLGVRSIILPGVKIGDNVIIGAGSIVTTDIPDNSVAVGNPAHVICSTSEYLQKHRNHMKTRPIYGNNCTIHSLDSSFRQVMKDELQDGIGYFKKY